METSVREPTSGEIESAVKFAPSIRNEERKSFVEEMEAKGYRVISCDKDHISILTPKEAIDWNYNPRHLDFLMGELSNDNLREASIYLVFIGASYLESQNLIPD